MRTVSVQLGNRSYAIKIGGGLLAQLGRECARLKLGARCAIITDTNVGRRFAKPAFDSLVARRFFTVADCGSRRGNGQKPENGASLL